MRIALLSLVLLALTVGVASSAQQRPRLALADTSPLTIRGTGFGLGERVRVTVRYEGIGTARRVRTSRSGAFMAKFWGVTTDRCTLVRVQAIGSSGRQAELKLLPGPACPPA